MIVQQGIPNEVHKLFVNHTYTSSCTVVVEESGLYLVSVIPIIEEAGIIDANVEYREVILVGNNHDTTTLNMPGMLLANNS